MIATILLTATMTATPTTIALSVSGPGGNITLSDGRKRTVIRTPWPSGMFVLMAGAKKAVLRNGEWIDARTLTATLTATPYPKTWREVEPVHYQDCDKKGYAWEEWGRFSVENSKTYDVKRCSRCGLMTGVPTSCIGGPAHDFVWTTESWGPMVGDPQGLAWKHRRYQHCRRCGLDTNFQGAVKP